MIPFLVEAMLGVLVLFFSVFLWFVSRRLSAAMLSITSLFFYCFTAMKILEYFKLFVAPAARRTSIFHIFLLLITCSLIATLVAFIREEKKGFRRSDG
jgi:hypothetical protein